MKYSLIALVAAATAVTAAPASTTVTVSQQTWFGWPDNCEDGYTQGCGNNDVAYNCNGRNYKAGGDGSHSNPLTYATKKGGSLHTPCEITYFPYLRKYLIMSDICTGCDDKQIDIWIGDGDGGQAELNCENDSPSGNGHKLTRQPSSSLATNTNALWNGGCHVSSNVYSNA
ncbi:Hypothetical protein R9X50_00422300 [Acrodontium crateriforme]|uniref:Uncharacterized protein n=1 Tax=Acrodontium crateriforme TaxID=150365 RepID=A0AAQ3RCJ1_9PEZI|nr:Hypothetical protein R9X50_00422300 [Acrodontium crateriforme]